MVFSARLTGGFPPQLPIGFSQGLGSQGLSSSPALGVGGASPLGTGGPATGATAYAPDAMALLSGILSLFSEMFPMFQSLGGGGAPGASGANDWMSMLTQMLGGAAPAQTQAEAAPVAAAAAGAPEPIAPPMAPITPMAPSAPGGYSVPPTSGAYQPQPLANNAPATTMSQPPIQGQTPLAGVTPTVSPPGNVATTGSLGKPTGSQNNGKYSPQDIDRIIREKSAQYGIDPFLVKAVALTESGASHYKADGTVKGSGAGAIGIMQLMPGTARGLGVDPMNVEQNIEGGVKYLAKYYKQYNGDIPKTLAAYNAGPGAVQKYNGVPPYPETQKHIERTVAHMNRLRQESAQTGGAAEESLAQGEGQTADVAAQGNTTVEIASSEAKDPGSQDLSNENTAEDKNPSEKKPASDEKKEKVEKVEKDKPAEAADEAHEDA